jgi:hypothetical protein
MHANELLPGGCLFPLRRWGDIMALENVADHLVANCVPQVFQGTRDAVIALTAVFPGQPHDQRL